MDGFNRLSVQALPFTEDEGALLMAQFKHYSEEVVLNRHQLLSPEIAISLSQAIKNSVEDYVDIPRQANVTLAGELQQLAYPVSDNYLFLQTASWHIILCHAPLYSIGFLL